MSEMTTEQRAKGMVGCFFMPLSSRDVAVLARAINAAEERGRVEMREKCAVCAESGPSWATPQEAAFFIRALPTSTSSEDQASADKQAKASIANDEELGRFNARGW